MTLREQAELASRNTVQELNTEDLQSSLSTAATNEELSSDVYRNTTAGLDRMASAFTNDGSKEDAYANELQSAQRGVNPITGVEIEASGISDLIVGGGLYGASRVAGTMAAKSLQAMNPFVKGALTKSASEIAKEAAEESVKKALVKGLPKYDTADIIGVGTGEYVSSQYDAPVAYKDERTGGTNYKVTDESQMAALIGNVALSAAFESGYQGYKTVKQGRTNAEKLSILQKDTNDGVLSIDSDGLINLNKQLGHGDLEKNGFRLVDDVNAVTELQNKGDDSSTGELEGRGSTVTTSEQGAFIDKDGNFRVTSEFLGNVVGTLQIDADGNGRLVIDTEASDLGGQALSTDYKGVPIFRAFEKKATQETTGTTQPYTSGSSLTIDDNGNVSGTTELIKQVDSETDFFAEGLTDEQKSQALDTELARIRQDPTTTSRLPESVIKIARDARTEGHLAYRPNNQRVDTAQTLTGSALINNAKTGTNPLLDTLIDIRKPRGTEDVYKNELGEILSVDKSTVHTDRDGRPQDAMLDVVYNTKNVVDSDSNVVGHTVTGINKDIVDALDASLDYAMATSDVQKTSGQRNSLTPKALDGLASKTAQMMIDTLGIKPLEGRTPTDVEAIKTEFAMLAQKIIDSDSQRLIKEKIPSADGTTTRTAISGNDIVDQLRDTLEKNGGGIGKAGLAWRQINQDLTQAKGGNPIITKSGSSTKPKTKSKAFNPSSKIQELLDKEANLEFEVTADGLKYLVTFEGMSKSEKMQYLNDGEAIDTLSTNAKENLEVDVLAFDDQLLAARDLFDGMKSDSVVKFPTEIMESNRVRYFSTHNPISSKLFNIVYTPKVDTVDLTIGDNMIQAKRGTLALLGEKVQKMTNTEVNSTFNEMRFKKVKVQRKGKTVEVALKNLTNLEKSYFAASKEGAITLVGIDQFIRMKNGETNLRILHEIDGTNNGPAIGEVLAGNFNEPAYGINSPSGVLEGDDVYTQMLDIIETSKNDVKYSNNLLISILDGLERKDVKYPVIAKGYGSGTRGTADTLASYIYGKFIKNLGEEKLTKNTEQVMRHLSTVVDMTKNTDITKYQEVNQKTYDKIAEIRQAQLNKADKKDIDSLKNELEGLQSELKTLKVGNSSYYDGINVNDLVSAHRKLVKDRENAIIEHTGVKQDGFIPQDVVLTADEIVAINQLISKNVDELVKHTFDTMFEHPKNLNIAPWTREYDSQLNRHEYKQSFNDFTEESFRSFSQLYTDKSRFTPDAVAKQVDDISTILARGDDTVKSAELISKEIYSKINRTSNQSIMNLFDATIAAGYRVDDIMIKWKPIRDITPTIQTHFGTEVSLLNIDSQMGVDLTSNNKIVNVGSVGFRMINDPMIAIGHDADFMSYGLGKGQMSVMDATWGSLDTVLSSSIMNEKFADTAMNYNIFKQMGDTLDKYRKMLSNKPRPDDDMFFFMARSSGSKVDFMDTVAKFEEASIEKGTWSEAGRKQILKDLNTKALDHKSKQSTVGSLDMANYANGSKEVVGTSTHKDYQLDKSTEEYSTTNEINLDNFKEVEIGDINNNTIEGVKFYGVDGLHDLTTTNTELKFSNQSNYGDNIITISDSKLSADSVGILSHEVSHRASELVDTGMIYQYIQNYVNTGKVKLTMIDRSTGKTIKNSVQLLDEEALANIGESLIYNDMLMSNSKYFATAFNEPDIASIVNQQYLTVDTLNGPTKLHTFSQLVDHIKNTSDDTLLHKQLDDYYKAFAATVNGSIDIRNWMNGYQFEKFKSNITASKSLHKAYDMAHKNNLMKFSSDLLRKNPSIGSLFYLDPKSEAMATIAALTKGADAIHSDLIAGQKVETIEKIENIVKGKFEVSHVDNSMGQFIASGVHYLLDEVSLSTDYTDFTQRLSSLDYRRDDLKLVDSFVDDILTDIGKDLSADAKAKLVKKTKKDISSIISGNKYKGAQNTVQAMYEILGRLDNVLKSKPNQLLTMDKGLINKYAPILDKWVAAGRMGSKSKHFVDPGYMKKIFNQLLKGDDTIGTELQSFLDTWKTQESQLRLKDMYTHQFAINPKHTYKTNSYRLSTNGSAANRAGSIKVGNTLVPIYYVPVKDLTLGQQQSVLMNPKISEFESGNASISLGNIQWDKSTDSGYVEVEGNRVDLPDVKKKSVGKPIKGRVSPDAMMKSQLRGDAAQSMDYSFSTMNTRNSSMLVNERIKLKGLHQQIKIGLDAGLFLTKEQYMNEGTDKSLYNVLGRPVTEEGDKIGVSNNNEYITKHFGELYYERRHFADIEGSKGMNIGKHINDAFGPGASNVINGFIKGAVGARDILKQTTLLWNAGSWVNSGFSAMSIYMVHANPGTMIADKKAATNAIDTYKSKSKAYRQAVLDNDSAGIKKAQDDLESTELYTAMSMGISSTIRQDVYANRAYTNNPIYEMIDNLTQDKGVSSAVKKFQLDPSTDVGQRVGSVFDNLEIMPKMMLYFNKKKTMSDQQAAQYTTMANPQYARNLAGIWNIVDQFSPYTKYFVSYPTMTMFAANQNPGKLATSLLLTKAMMIGSWKVMAGDLTPEEEQMMDEGYLRIPGTNQAKYMGSMNNYFLPSKSFGTYTVADMMFVPDGLDRLIVPFDLTPTRTIPERPESTQIES